MYLKGIMKKGRLQLFPAFTEKLITESARSPPLKLQQKLFLDATDVACQGPR